MKRLPERLQIGWQVFVRRSYFVEYFTRSETFLELVKFDALCADCGKPFTAMATKSNWRTKRLRRRCDPHVRLGILVDNLKPPVKVQTMPFWARPVAGLIKSTGKRKRYSKAKTKRLMPSAKAPRQLRCEPIQPDTSYLD